MACCCRDWQCDVCLGKKQLSDFIPAFSLSDLDKGNLRTLVVVRIAGHARHAGSYVVLNGTITDRGVKRKFLLGRVASLSPLAVHWLAPQDPKAFLRGGWKPLMVEGKPHVDLVELGAVVMVVDLKLSSDSSESVHLTDDVIDLLKKEKLC